ncbi:MAG: sigma-54 dependent transcriptional regulator [Pseudomonadota bacterium]
MSAPLAPAAAAAARCPVLIVDDEAELRRSLSQWLSLGGFDPEVCATAEEALAALHPRFAGPIISDVRMPGADGLALLEAVAARDPQLPVILLTGHGDVAMAVSAMRAGAYDFVEKPFDPERLLSLVRRAAEARRLTLENRALRERLKGDSGLLAERLAGATPVMVALREAVAEAAESQAAVLITGETGAGKEVVARSLHDLSPRAAGPFVAVNCAAIPETLFEAAFFGHEVGAFTGAGRAAAGYLEAASGGTLFLDEVTSLPPHMQPVLLRALQEGEVQRLGARRPVKVDTRVVAATNADLEQEVASGRLRRDFLYRLNTLALQVPPLRDRVADIPLLFGLFASLAAAREGRPDLAETLVLTEADRTVLAAHDWPGNVRELANLAERAVVRARRGPVAIATLLSGDLSGWPADSGTAQAGGEDDPGAGLRKRLEAYERQLLEEALIAERGNVSAVMAALDLPRRTFNEKMARHGLAAKNYREG